MSKSHPSLLNMLTKIRERGLKLNANKSKIPKSSTNFFGHTISSDRSKWIPLKLKQSRKHPSENL